MPFLQLFQTKLTKLCSLIEWVCVQTNIISFYSRSNSHEPWMQKSPKALWDIITCRTGAGQVKVHYHLFDMLLSPGYLPDLSSRSGEHPSPLVTVMKCVAAGSLYYSVMWLQQHRMLWHKILFSKMFLSPSKLWGNFSYQVVLVSRTDFRHNVIPQNILVVVVSSSGRVQL